MTENSSEARLLQRVQVFKATEEDMLAAEIAAGVISTSSALEKFVSWLLVGTAATLLFGAVNAPALIQLFDSRSFQVAFYWLLISTAAGVLSRAAGAWLMGIEVAKKQMVKRIERTGKLARKRIGELSDEAARLGIEIDVSPNMVRVVDEATQYLSLPQRWWVKWQMKKAKPGPMGAMRIPVKLHNFQALFAFAQTGFAIAAFCLLISGLRSDISLTEVVPTVTAQEAVTPTLNEATSTDVLSSNAPDDGAKPGTTPVLPADEHQYPVDSAQ